MTPLVWMIGGAVLSWLLVTLVAPDSVNPEVLYGMAGPLGSAVVTWIVTDRTWRRAPERLTGVLAAGFAVKVVFFGVYATLMIRVVGVRPVPFAIGFTSYLIGLYLVEALFMRRLFVDGMRSAPSV
jgi:hypothetical protein